MKLKEWIFLLVFNAYSVLDFDQPSYNLIESLNFTIQGNLFEKCSNCVSLDNLNSSLNLKGKAELKQFCFTLCSSYAKNEITKDSVTVSNLAIILVSSISGGVLILFLLMTFICCLVSDCPWYNCCNDCQGKQMDPIPSQINIQPSYQAANQEYITTRNGQLIIGDGNKSTPLQIKSGLQRTDIQNQENNYNHNQSTNRDLKHIPTPIQIHTISANDGKNTPPLRINKDPLDQRDDFPKPIQILDSSKNFRIQNHNNLEYNELTGRSITEKPMQMKGYSENIFKGSGLDRSSKI